MSIKIENTQIFGWEAAIRGSRAPMNSWEKSDSWFINEYSDHGKRVNAHQIKQSYTNGDIWKDPELKAKIDAELTFANAHSTNGIYIGPNDHKLLMNLCKGGTEEAKWRRMIHVQMDVTAPLYWWKEFETYKVGTVSNSCSTMHKIQAKEFTLDDFSCEHLFNDNAIIVHLPTGNRGDFRIINSKQWLMFTCDLLNDMPRSLLQWRKLNVPYIKMRSLSCK